MTRLLERRVVRIFLACLAMGSWSGHAADADVQSYLRFAIGANTAAVLEVTFHQPDAEALCSKVTLRADGGWQLRYTVPDDRQRMRLCDPLPLSEAQTVEADDKNLSRRLRDVDVSFRRLEIWPASPEDGKPMHLSLVPGAACPGTMLPV